MSSIIFWFIGLLAIMFYGGMRIFSLYKSNCPSNKEYLKQGTILIFYSTLAVGAAQFLGDACTAHIGETSKPSLVLINIGLLAAYLKYLAPFVFAAVGVNMVSYAVTNKST